MMKICAWDDENERFHPVLRGLIPFYKEKMEKAEEKFLAMKKIYTTLLGMFADEMKQEELEKDECYGCAYGKCGPCIDICYKSVHEKTNRFQYRCHSDGNDHASVFLHGNV